MPIAMSKFAQKQALETHGIKSEYVPHAIELDNFYPLEETERYKLRAKWGYSDNDFVVMNVFRNQGRKFADRMIKCFAEWCKIYDLSFTCGDTGKAHRARTNVSANDRGDVYRWDLTLGQKVLDSLP